MGEDLTFDFMRRAEAMVEVGGRDRNQLPVQVPFWPEPLRKAPNVLLRSALFGCSRHTEAVEGAPIAAWGDWEIAFSGWRLTQFDETVWLQLVHLHRSQFVGAGRQKDFSARGLIKAIGASQGGAGLSRLLSSMRRLQGAVVEMRRGKEVRTLPSPVRSFAINKGTGRYEVELEPKWMELLEDETTLLSWETRKALPTGLATWLHRYILSHRATMKSPHRVGLRDLRALSGMGSPVKVFKQHLQKAMVKIEEQGVVASWRVTPNNALEFVRPRRLPKAG